jgi:large conductance mechanosensitive channel
MLKDFKAFVMRGNVLDLAVGVIIGGAFGKIVSSLVGDILMPIIGIISGGVNFSGLKFQISGSLEKPIFLTYGTFIQSLLDFLIIAICIFIIVRIFSKLKQPIPVSTKPCPFCQSTISIKATRCPYCTSQLSNNGK